uniref:Uncharacterized protein n=1 Tax=Oryza nivara TaxID=4536 RepID=A0A0E0HUW0_ORYNI
MGAKSEREMERARNTQEDEICNAKSEREMKHGEDECNEYTDEGNNVDEEEDEAATDVARKRGM